MNFNFFEGEDLASKKHARIRVPPAIPETGWRVPEFPNLDNACVIGFDVETRETDFDNGPGWARGKGHIVGLALSARDRLGNIGAWYFPVRHEVETHLNMDANNVFKFARHYLEQPHTEKIGANITYDMGWLREENINVQGVLHDVQFAEAIIDNEAEVALDTLGARYLQERKTTDLLYNWIREAYPNTPETKLRGDIYRSPPQLVGFYGEGDALLPIKIFDKQYKILNEQDLWRVYRLECDLIPLMIEMRRAGIQVDVNKAEQLRDELKDELVELYAAVAHKYGYRLESSSSGAVGRLFDYVGIEYPKTVHGAPSLRKEWLADLEHPLGDEITAIRDSEKLIGTFFNGYILGKNVHGRLHPQFKQLHGEDGGTKVGRFSSADPNLQNIPTRTPKQKKVRTCFTKRPNHYCWTKLDHSQIHYRILAHYAEGPGADELREAYITNPATDYHWNVYTNVAPLLNWDITDEELNDFRRRPIKNVNFGLLYGQSEKALGYKIASYFGSSFSEDDTKAFFKAYFDGAPYVKPTMKAIGREVQRHGFVTTVLGRRIRFNLWEPDLRERKKGDYYEPLPLANALARYGNPLRRAYEYRGVNYKFQGSEPDIMKQGMLNCWKSGVYDVLGVPCATVHDELNFSIEDNTRIYREAMDFAIHTMEQAVKLRIPLKVDEENGETWGGVKKIEKNEYWTHLTA